MKDKKQQRRRVGKEDVRNNARESGGGKKYFNLPKGVDLWEPEKVGSTLIDMVPYEIKTEVHPDRRGDKIVPGDLWWKFPYAVHEKIGPGAETVVCPASFGKPCPICEERAALAKDYDNNKEAIKAINAKKQAAYVIKNPDDADRYSVFAYSCFKFGDVLDEELKTGGDEVLSFYDVTGEGKTLKVRWAEEEYMGRKFFKANRIDFVERAEMDEDEVLNAVPCLDEIFIVMDYEPLKKLFLQIPADEDAPAGKATATRQRTTPAATASTGKGTKTASAEPEAKFKDDDRVQFKLKGKTVIGVVIDVDQDDITVKLADGTEEEVDVDDLEPAPPETKANKTKAKEDAPASATNPEFAIGITVKDEDDHIGVITKIKKDNITFKQADGTVHTVDIADLEVVPPEADAETKTEFKVGDKVKDDDGTEGVITKIKGSDITMKTSDGNVLVDVDDIELLEDEADASDPEPDAGDGSYTAKVGDMVKFTDANGDEVVGKITKIADNDDATIKDAAGTKHTVDVDELEPADEDEGAEDAALTFEVGDEVTWDNGNEEGTITKLHSGGEKAKVKDDVGVEEWQQLTELKKKLAAKATKKK